MMTSEKENNYNKSDKLVLKKFAEREKKAKERRNVFGKIKPIINKKINSFNYIAVGDEIHYSKNWVTFVDFLLDFIWIVLGNDWKRNELCKPLSERHQILKWYDGVVNFHSKQIKGEDGLYHVKQPNGVFAAFLLLAYDLYLIRHHQSIKDALIKRLKNQDQFQGARYEMFVASSCIRAGFDIDFENERDSSKKHVEFIVTHKKTGQKISIEAKSKHRQGIFGFQGERKSIDKVSVGKIIQLINKALKKEVIYPLVLFVDVNMPPDNAKKLLGEEDGISWLAKKFENVNTLKNGKDFFNLIIFTNHPHLYGRDDEPDPKRIYSTSKSLKPNIKVEYSQALEDLLIGVLQYGNIPSEFPDNDNKVL